LIDPKSHFDRRPAIIMTACSFSQVVTTLVWLLLSTNSSNNKVSAFTTSVVVASRQQRSSLAVLSLSAPQSTTSTTTSPLLIISGVNVHITPALEEHVHKRIGKALSKFSSSVITECDVVLSLSKNPKVRRPGRLPRRRSRCPTKQPTNVDGG
jgi:Sigma 54 modulation protein / S30EA ribosomal protein